jgi:hypothetical protein
MPSRFAEAFEVDQPLRSDNRIAIEGRKQSQKQIVAGVRTAMSGGKSRCMPQAAIIALSFSL